MGIITRDHPPTSLMGKRNLKSRPSIVIASMGNHGDFNTSSNGKAIPALIIRGKITIRYSRQTWSRNTISDIP
jgi:hypothetical protein